MIVDGLGPRFAMLLFRLVHRGKTGFGPAGRHGLPRDPDRVALDSPTRRGRNSGRLPASWKTRAPVWGRGGQTGVMTANRGISARLLANRSGPSRRRAALRAVR